MNNLNYWLFKFVLLLLYTSMFCNIKHIKRSSFKTFDMKIIIYHNKYIEMINNHLRFVVRLSRKKYLFYHMPYGKQKRAKHF